MAKIILTGVDKSQTARQAAEAAANLADAFGAELHVISAFIVSAKEVHVESRNEVKNQAEVYRRLEKKYQNDAELTASTVAAELRKQFPSMEIVTTAIQGEPGAALLREAEKLQAEVIVVGNRRVQGPSRILGSIARTVAAEARCDLYVVNTHHK